MSWSRPIQVTFNRIWCLYCQHVLRVFVVLLLFYHTNKQSKLNYSFFYRVAGVCGYWKLPFYIWREASARKPWDTIAFSNYLNCPGGKLPRDFNGQFCRLWQPKGEGVRWNILGFVTVPVPVTEDSLFLGEKADEVEKSITYSLWQCKFSSECGGRGG